MKYGFGMTAVIQIVGIMHRYKRLHVSLKTITLTRAKHIFVCYSLLNFFWYDFLTLGIWRVKLLKHLKDLEDLQKTPAGKKAVRD